MGKILKEQRIISRTLEAIAYRNIHRPKVDKLFILKLKNTKARRLKFDRLARQLWREVIAKSNKL